MPPQKHLCKQSVACCQGLMRTPIFKLILYDEKQHVPMLMTIALKMIRYSLKKEDFCPNDCCTTILEKERRRTRRNALSQPALSPISGLHCGCFLLNAAKTFSSFWRQLNETRAIPRQLSACLQKCRETKSEKQDIYKRLINLKMCKRIKAIARQLCLFKVSYE